MKKHFKLVLAFLLFICILISDVKPVRAAGIRNAWDTYYNWLVDLNYRKYNYSQDRLKKQYKNVKNFLEIATKIFTNEALDHNGSHGGGGHSRDGADVLDTQPVSEPQPIYKNYDNSVYNPVTNNYETIEYYYDDYSTENYVYSFETTNNFITYEYNYTYYDIVVSPKDSPTEGKFFKVYYELPDGRSSFNLTPNDLNGVIFNYDVVNYERTVTDSDVLGIWHLDGDFINSVDNTYWASNLTTFVDGRFGGAVSIMPYLERYRGANSLTLRVYDINTLPSEWTLEFWVYIPNVSSTMYNYGSSYYESIPYHNQLIPEGWHTVAITSDRKMFFDGIANYYTSDFTTDKIFRLDSPDGWAIGFWESGGWVMLRFESNLSVYDTRILNGLTINQCIWGQYTIDEIKLTKRVLYTSDYYPRFEPYDLNFAYTVPELNQDYSTIAIQSPVAVHNTQIGGVRSSSPVNGDVFISLYDGRATSVNQYYNGVWNTVNGAVYLNGIWYDLLRYDFNTLMLSPGTDANTGATYIVNYYYGGGDGFVDISGDDITFTIDTTDANPQDVLKILKWIPLLFGAVGTILGALCPFLPAWLTGLIALCLGCVLTLILFVFIRRK